MSAVTSAGGTVHDPADEHLWARLHSAVRSNGLSVNDVFNCDNPSRLRLFDTLGFNEGESQALLRISTEKDTKGPKNPGSTLLPVASSSSTGSGYPTAASGSSSINAHPTGVASALNTFGTPPTGINGLGGTATATPPRAAGGIGSSFQSPPQQQPIAAASPTASQGIPPHSGLTPNAGSTAQTFFGSPNPTMPNGTGVATSGFSGLQTTSPPVSQQPPVVPFAGVSPPLNASAMPGNTSQPLHQPVQSMTQPPSSAPQPSTTTTTMGSTLPRPQPSSYIQQEATGIQGLSRVGDQLIARCSVYPELPAEFWCCACNVLVSSRCHVQGIHKDHPFITLRLAAEAHVRDLTAWNERCRSQLNVTESVLSNLRHAEGVVQQQGQREFDALEAQVQQIVEDLMRWKEQLRADMQGQMASQISSIQTAAHRTEELHTLYSTQLQTCEPLMANIPPVDQSDRTSEDWALKVLDFVSKLKNVNTEPIPMPRLLVPEVTCNATPVTHMELLKAVSKPVGVRLPDLLDPGYFNFPQPAASARVPFTLNPPDDAQAKGIVVYNGRTLTRSQDVVPSHTLVSGSQVFYSGVVSWEVNIDRLGTGPGRVLAGVIIHGSEGEGIVWDGQRIVGPNEGECRTLDERYQMRPGTVLRFVLELEGPTCYLGCFFNRDGVARIPIPATGNGWTPAFSVFGPQDQVTVVPTSGTQRADDMFAMSGTPSRRPGALSPETSSKKLREQEHMIASLQQQLNAVHNRIDNDQFNRAVSESTQRGDGAPPRQNDRTPTRGGSTAATSAPLAASPSATATASPKRRDIGLPPTPQRPAGLPPREVTTPGSVRGASVASSVNRPNDAYSPELRQLMRFVDETR